MEVRHETVFQIHTTNVMTLGLGEVAAHFELVVNTNYRLVAPQPRRTTIGGCPKVASYDMLGEQLQYSNWIKWGRKKINPCVQLFVRINSKVKKVTLLQNVGNSKKNV